MISRQECRICHSLMMYEIQEGKVIYTCVAQDHGPIGTMTVYSDIHISAGMAKELKETSDLIWEYIKRP